MPRPYFKDDVIDIIEGERQLHKYEILKAAKLAINELTDFFNNKSKDRCQYTLESLENLCVQNYK